MSGYCGKGCLYFYNLIYLGISGVLMYLSVLFVWKWGDYSSLIANTYTIIPTGVIFVFGVMVMITSIVGMCGNCYENRCTLGVFFSMLLVICSFEVVAGTLVYVKDTEIKVSLKENLQVSFDNYYKSSYTIRRAFDKMQRTFECCGVMGPNDWHNTSVEIPGSCCAHPGGLKCYNLPSNLYKVGCWSQLRHSYSDNVRYLTGIALAFVIFQLLGIILTVYMIIVLRRNLTYKRLLDIHMNR